MKRILLNLLFVAPLILSAQDFSVMSFNVRYANDYDGENCWENRRERLVDAINFYSPDLLGTQETLHNQLEYILEKCPQYGYVGVGRQDGKEMGEYSAVFYKRDRYELLDSGWFWLSETPEVAGSKGWDGACERIASWAKLLDRQSGKQLFMIDTHLDHIGEIARREGISLLLERIASLSGGVPVIATGDFNSLPDDPVIAHMTSGSPIKLSDSRERARVVYGPEWTFHDYWRAPVEERKRIDYIFISDELHPDRYASLAEMAEGFLSDHNPVLVYFKWD